MNLNIDQGKIDFIKKTILSNRKYINNEDLFDDFFNETCKRSLVIIKTLKNEASLEAYLKKIVNTSILQVLKDSGRVRRTSEGFIRNKEESLHTLVNNSVSNKFSDINISYDVIDLSDGPEEIAIKKDVLQNLYDAIVIANSTNPTKEFLSIYNLRYVKKLKQREIAHELNISQGEVSKRLLELMEEVKNTLNS